MVDVPQSKGDLLLIADTSVPEALGSKLVRAAVSLKLKIGSDLQIVYHSPAPQFSPSMQRLRGKLFYRLGDRRSWEWWGFQRQLKDKIRMLRPRLVLVTGILPLQASVMKEIKVGGGRIVNYLTDDPWNPIHRRRSFLQNLSHYDHIFSTKKALCRQLEQAGTPSTSWLPFAYDPDLHHPPLRTGEGPPADVLFIGTGAPERLPWLDALQDLDDPPRIRRRIHGNNWTGLRTPGWERRPEATGDAYCEAIHSAGIVLGLLRQANGDLSTDRSYEIGAIGGCGLYQDSIEHRALLPKYPDAGFFSTPAQLRKRVQQLLANPSLRTQLREQGAQALRRPEHTYAARLKTMLNWSED